MHVTDKTSPRDFQFVIADVFTDTAFGGNQLAVFPDASGMTDEAMQQIAREFNFAETTFVVPTKLADCVGRIRIFTPKRELPFAGHPTVGTAAVLAWKNRGGSSKDSLTQCFEETIGPVMVRIGDVEEDRIFTELRLDTAIERPAANPVPEDIAAALSLQADDVLHCWFAAVGPPFCFIHLRSRAAVDAAVLDRQAWLAKIAATWAPQLFFFAGDFRSGGRVYARMFAPAFGIDEDPATGSACVGLVGSLAEKEGSHAGTTQLDIEQGVSMGRPSLMRAEARCNGATSRMILSVGGTSIVVAQGSMRVRV